MAGDGYQCVASETGRGSPFRVCYDQIHGWEARVEDTLGTGGLLGLVQYLASAHDACDALGRCVVLLRDRQGPTRAVMVEWMRMEVKR